MLLTHWNEGGGAAVDASTSTPEADRTLDSSAEKPQAIVPHAGRLIEQMVTWTGPLPPPAAMREDEQVLPGASERILALTERQVEHRHRIEEQAVRASIVIERRGQWVAALIGVLAIACGTYLTATNHDGWGFATIVTAIAGLLGAAVFSRRLQDRESGQALDGPPTTDPIRSS